MISSVRVQGVTESSERHLVQCIRDVLIQGTNDLSWLKRGDVVLIKPALNSRDPYPATTHPVAVAAVSALLKERGATVVVGDQSGIASVLACPDKIIRGSTRQNCVMSGMGSLDDDSFVSFEDGGWNTGFYHHQSPHTRSWLNGFYLTTQALKADHIINLPRVSSHAQAGVTLGLKCLVGLLREDSRIEFHANGPLNQYIIKNATGSGLPSQDDHTGTFFEKIVEISDAIRDKLRFTLFTATKIQVLFGPDRFEVRRGDKGLGRAYEVSPKPGLVFGSANPVAAEAVALALVLTYKRSTPLVRRLYEMLVLHQNPYIRELYSLPVKEHPFIRHAQAIGLGSFPDEIIYQDVPREMQNQFAHLLE
ncbi:MAG: DUF362 domain-containing protein [Methanobacteriota archaeon]